MGWYRAMHYWRPDDAMPPGLMSVEHCALVLRSQTAAHRAWIALGDPGSPWAASPFDVICLIAGSMDPAEATDPLQWAVHPSCYSALRPFTVSFVVHFRAVGYQVDGQPAPLQQMTIPACYRLHHLAIPGHRGLRVLMMSYLVMPIPPAPYMDDDVWDDVFFDS